jgi:hypothetical protein
VGTAAPSVKLAKVDRAKLEASMKDVVERAAAADPKALRARIATLERELAEMKQLKPPAPERVEVPVLQPHELEALRGMVDRMYELQGGVREAFDRLVNATHQVHRDHAGAYTVPAGPGERGMRPSPAMIPDPLVTSRPSTSVRSAPPAMGARGASGRPASMNGDVKLTKGELALLHALLEKPHLRTPARKAALVSGYSVRSSTFRNILSGLRTKGLITGGRDGLMVTDEGYHAGGGQVHLPAAAGGNLAAYWLDRVGRQSMPGRVLHELLGYWPNSVAREDLAKRAGSSPDSSTYRNALSRLRTLELIEGRAEIRAVDELGVA